MTPILQLSQADAGGTSLLLQIGTVLFILINLLALLLVLLGGSFRSLKKDFFYIAKRLAGRFLIYEVLVLGALLMLLPFYWMVVTSFKDGQTSSAPVPIWTPKRIQTLAPDPETGEFRPIVALDTASATGEEVPVVPDEQYEFQTIQENGYTITKEVPEDEEEIFYVDPSVFQQQMVLDMDLKNFRRAWYRPETTTRGEVNFLTYFFVSIFTSICTTTGALTTSALAAFAFARMQFFGRTYLFYVILATMMVPGQVLLIPNFLILSTLGLLDTFAALIVPWMASVFTIFLMRQFFMTVPNDLYDASRIDGASRFRFLWQVVVPLSKPVFITAGIFDFLNNWNSLLWPLIVTSSPNKRTLMVGLQSLSTDAGSEFHILMAASCLAIFPIVVGFFILQRYFIEGIARTGLK